MAHAPIRNWLAASLLMAGSAFFSAHAQQTLTIAAYPAVDEIAKAAIPAWKKKHPGLEIKITSRAFGRERRYPITNGFRG